MFLIYGKLERSKVKVQWNSCIHEYSKRFGSGFIYLLLELLRVVWVHQKVACPVLCKEHQLLHHCWYPNWEQHQLKWKYLKLVEVLEQFMCIKESRYHPLCNGRLDAAPVHDLELLPVANIKTGRILWTRCHTGMMMMQLMMMIMMIVMIKKERERNNDNNFHIHAGVDQSCTSRKTHYRLLCLTCPTLHHCVPIEFFCGRQF